MRRYSLTGRRLAYRTTPPIGRALAATNLTRVCDDVATYLNFLVGKGSGAGWDVGETLAAATLLRPFASPTVVDCGANRGNWVNAVRSALGHAEGRWLLVEPASEYACALKVIPNAVVVQAAVGAEVGEAVLYLPDRPSGWMSLHRRLDSFTEGTSFSEVTVPVTTLDSILQDHSIDRVHLLKMDIEGHELFALHGLAQALAASFVDAIAFEFGSANVNSRTYFKDFWLYLGDRHFDIFRILPGGPLLSIPAYDETLEYFRGATNYVAIRQDSEIRASLVGR